MLYEACAPSILFYRSTRVQARASRFHTQFSANPERTIIFMAQVFSFFHRERVNKELLSEQEAGLLAYMLHEYTLLRFFPDELSDLPHRERCMLLDVRCGTGKWGLDTAYDHPKWRVFGIDEHANTIEHAQALAGSQGISNVYFSCVDLKKSFPFADESYDVIHLRCTHTNMPSLSLWPHLLSECHRLLRAGGLLCLSACTLPLVNSQAISQLCSIIIKATHHAGYTNALTDVLGLTDHPGSARVQAHFRLVSEITHVLDISERAEAYPYWFRHILLLAQHIHPYLIQEQLVPDCWDQLLQQAQIDMLQGGFEGKMDRLTVWAACQK